MAICCPAEFVDGAVAIQMARHFYLREAAWYKQTHHFASSVASDAAKS